jgi:hypothetical protein
MSQTWEQHGSLFPGVRGVPLFDPLKKPQKQWLSASVMIQAINFCCLKSPRRVSLEAQRYSILQVAIWHEY